MKFTVVTLFPEMFTSVMEAGVLGRGKRAGRVEIDYVNPRDFAVDVHRTVDDAPYGGGPGMLMKAEPLLAAIRSVAGASIRVLLTPGGTPLTQRRVMDWSRVDHMLLVCGRYEGVDERVIELAIDESVSVGDFVLSGGEIAAMAVIDATSRHVPGVLGAAESADDESFSRGLLEYPHYTRPDTVESLTVPPILQSGHHQNIRDWRTQQALERTLQRRPDLVWNEWCQQGAASAAARTYVLLAHYPVYDRNRQIVTTSVTNLDIHDIARSATTYGLRGFAAISPIALQQEKMSTLVATWRDQIDQRDADDRRDALARVTVAGSIGEALVEIAGRHAGTAPLVVATSANPSPDGPEVVTRTELAALAMANRDRPLALLFGTGWGLAPEALQHASWMLEPILGFSDYNHLSVRSAAAIVLDRLFAPETGIGHRATKFS